MFSLEDTIDEVKAEARAEGMEKGREKGREEERRKLALSMLKDGFNGEEIQKHTGLSQKEIEGLKV